MRWEFQGLGRGVDNQVDNGRAVKGWATRQEVEQGRAEGPNITGFVRLLGIAALFRGSEFRSADEDEPAIPGGGGAGAQASDAVVDQPEIHQFDRTMEGHDQVVRLHVPVDETVGVGMGQGCGGLAGKVEGLGQGEGAVRIDDLGRRPTRGVFHDTSMHPGRRIVDQVVDRHQSRMAELAGGPGFTNEGLDISGILQARGMGDLDGHLAVDRQLSAKEDRAHAAASKQTLDPIAGDLGQGDASRLHGGKHWPLPGRVHCLPARGGTLPRSCSIPLVCCWSWLVWSSMLGHRSP